MTIPASLQGKLRLPIIGSPLFIASTRDLVVEQCRSGVIGTFPALNARPQEALVDWIAEIRERLAAASAANPEAKIAPFGVNQVMSELNTRWQADLTTIVREKVPLIISSLRAPPPEIISEVHSYGGLVFHDVTNIRHARKAASMGVDGLILVCAGAGGQGGDRSPFALINEVRQFFDGVIILAGSISTGQDVLAAQAMGADFAYMGTRFLASKESGVSEVHKGEATLTAAGLDINNLPKFSPETAKYRKTDSGEIKVWKDIRGCGHGCGSITEQEGAAQIVDSLEAQYRAALAKMQAAAFA